METTAPMDRLPIVSLIRAITVGLLVVIAVVGLLLMPVPMDSRASSALGDLVHAPLFGGLALGTLVFLGRLWPIHDRSQHVWIRLLIVATAWFLFGATMEVVQQWAGRTGRLHDALANGWGIVAGCSLYVLLRQWNHPNRRRWMVGCLGLSVFAMFLAWKDPVAELLDFARVRTQFPLLASFESPRGLARWHCDDCRVEHSTRGVTDGQQSMKVVFSVSPHPAATLIDVPTDWSGFDTLELDVLVDDESASESFDFVLKVIDQHHADYHADTFRRTWRLTRGQQTHLVIHRDEVIAGPDDRDLDASRIKFLSLQVLQPDQPTVLYVDRIGLQFDSNPTPN
ncbi:VanZ family protein [Crateriforma spongiae]|uniref:hypothetical protein n=1 Tax=Crateriforma spongiae TaxID=2724528 RepID=UPI0014455270|nr:hypothetical protein [Crateriforma spongiae]